MPSVTDTFVENRVRVQPDDTNNYDSAHGGNVVKWMDEVGAMSAMRLAGNTCVTARINGLDFERPIPRGDICAIESYAYAAGTSSVRVRLRAFREDPRTGVTEQTTSSHFVFVAVDEDMKPTTVPELTADTERDQRLRQGALASEERDGE